MKSSKQRQVAEKTRKRSLHRIQQSRTGRPPKIELFQKEDSPYCHAVRSHLSALGLDYIAHSVPDDNALKHEQLIQAGGRDEIPFFIDHSTGTQLYDSDAILSYLDAEYGRPEESIGIAAVAKNIETRIRARAEQLGWAIRAPFEKVRNLRHETAEALRSVRRSYFVLKDSIAEPSPEEREPPGKARLRKAG